jgi:Flp pilus assembly protein TadD/peroxiredoxin
MILPVARRMRRTTLVVGGLLAALIVVAAGVRRAAGQQEATVYQPELATPELVAPFLKYLAPGSDAFSDEQKAEEIEARLRVFGERLKTSPDRPADATDGFLAPGFRGGRLVSMEESATRPPAFEVRRTEKLPQDLLLDSRSFAAELGRMLAGLRQVTVAELLVTSIDVEQDNEQARTDVRYDIVGPGKTDWRIQHTGVWRMTWRQAPAGWQVVQWTASSHVLSRAGRPVFTEVTEAALGGNDSFRRQLGIDLDTWMATFDSVLTRDSNGHHGVSVGDADEDGLDDIYVAQPAGLPNVLFRNRGDGTFEDITERAGVGILDDTSQAVFADVENDGDQDLVVGTPTGMLLFVNDGTGRFSHVPDAYQFKQPLQGAITSITMADYDRDGFLDLYVCVYSYFFGAGEDKAGTPMPYYDARNGPPSVLFRNDGRGRFVDVTKETGLDVGNDRYSFAAAWSDYNNDGWPDLLVVNDFGINNLYRSRGRHEGKITFEEVAAEAGVLDHAAGMSATFIDYDNDGLLDIYTGNMWSASGQRVTSAPTFMPDASPDVRALYQRHARGNSLFRSLGNGRFEDVTRSAGAEMGRWAWSSDTLDFDSDGWEDVYIANGMLTRAPGRRARESGPQDLESFFWRQVVARSPATRATGTPYDEAWFAINQLLIHRSIASRQRNVFLRNNGRGGFDNVAGTMGLDLDQDGRAFAALDLGRDGDPDLVVMAVRGAPHLRVFRNDFAPRGAALALRLTGTTSNRDAIGARVTVKTDRLRRTKVVQAGSGFLSQHSKELLIGLGPSERVLELEVAWPSGHRQRFTDVPLNHRLQLEEGGEPRAEPFIQGAAQPANVGVANGAAREAAAPPSATWLYEPFPAPDFSASDLAGQPRSLSALQGRPAVLLFWTTDPGGSRAALQALAQGTDALDQAGVGAVAIALDPAANREKVRAAASGVTVPVVHASEELGGSVAILNRHIFMNRQPLHLPTAFLLDASGQVVRVYRDRVDVSEVVQDVQRIEVAPDERLARAVPFPGRFYQPPGLRNYLPYGRELLDQGLEAAALVAFERAADARPTASTLYRIGTLLVKTGETERAQVAFERALALDPELAEASNDLGALLAEGGDVDAAIERFRAALAATPEYPDALNNLGYALLLTGQDKEARALYEKALALQPDFPEALNNLGLLVGRGGDLDRAGQHFQDALALRDDYGEAANNLALVLVAQGKASEAIRLLEGFLEKAPQVEDTYVTLAKIYLSTDQVAEGLGVLERLLQKNPTHPVARELVRQWKPR